MWPFRSQGRRRDTSRSSLPAHRLGARGETLARKHLRRAGCKILATNYRCPLGEADLIALDRTAGRETIVFVEVKTRSGDAYTDPESAVNAQKRRRLRKIAEYYLTVKNAHDRPVRFDVVSVVLRPGQAPELHHIPDAF